MASSYQTQGRHVTGDNTPRQDNQSLFSIFTSCITRRSKAALNRPKASSLEKLHLPAKEANHVFDEHGSTTTHGPVRADPYHWPENGRLEPATTALVIIDMQRDFCEDGGYMAHQGYDITPAKAVIKPIKSLLIKYREAGYPIYFTREGHRPDLSTLSSREQFRSRNNTEHLGIGDKGPLGRLLIRGEPGHHIIKDLRPLPNEAIIDKPGRGAFAHTDFGLLLSLKGIKNLIICGVTTDVCVTSTMREANDRGYDCVLVSDACAAGETSLHEAAVQSIKEEGGIFGTVTTSEELLRALEEKNAPPRVPTPNDRPSSGMPTTAGPNDRTSIERLRGESGTMEWTEMERQLETQRMQQHQQLMKHQAEIRLQQQAAANYDPIHAFPNEEMNGLQRTQTAQSVADSTRALHPPPRPAPSSSTLADIDSPEAPGANFV